MSILSYKNRFKRDNIIKKLQKYKNRILTLIHPRASIGKNCKIGVGSIIYNNSNIYSGSSVGNFSTISSNVSIAPKSRIESNCFIGHGAVIASGVYLRKNSYIGIKSSIIENAKKRVVVISHSIRIRKIIITFVVLTLIGLINNFL